MAKPENNAHFELVDLFEQVSALFSANAAPVTNNVMKLMTPLINDNQGFQEHRAFLKSKLHGLEYEQ